MRASRSGLALAVVLAVALRARPASAHLMPHQQGTLNVVDAGVFVVLALPLTGLGAVDDDGDGRLSTAELGAHQAAISDVIARGVRITDAAQPGRLEFLQLSAEVDEGDPASVAGGTHVVVLMKVAFPAPPTALRLELDVWGDTAADRQLTLRATRGADAEAVVLTPGHPAHRCFGSPVRIAREFVGVGVAHILGGLDHLLFLLTILVAVRGWRASLAVVTTFTLAHGATLTLALLGTIDAPAALIEPLIAASIVVVALLNLRARPTRAAHHLGVVFACGLLHGLGFASALGDLGLHGANRVASLVGFNLGIELGQGLFLAVVAALGLGLRAVWRRAGLSGARYLAPTPVISALAALIGLVWFVTRLGAS